MFHLHLELPTWSPPDNQTEVADSAGCHERKMATITADEVPIKAVWRGDKIDLAPHHEQNLRLLRKLVADANAAPSMRRELSIIFEELVDRYDGAPDSTTLWMGTLIDGIRAALLRTMPDAELNAKATSDRVINALARDIAAYPDHRAQVDTGRLIAQHTQRAVDKVMGAMGLAYLLDEATPPSIAAHPDAILHSDDSPPIDLLDDKLRAEHGADDFAKRAPRIYEDGRPD